MEINFYQIDDLLHKSIAPLLVKILETEKRVLIYDDNQELLNKIDDGLWSFSKTKFLPHATKWGKFDVKRQPILLTNEQENSNDADYLIILQKDNSDFWKNFSKTCYFFDDSSLGDARQMWSEHKEKGSTVNFYRRESGEWLKVK